MKFFNRVARVVCLCGALAAAAPAAAQEPAGRPPVRPLFGGGVSQWEQSLVAGLSLAAGFDRDRSLITDPLSLTTFELARRGRTAVGGAHLTYGLTLGRFSVGASAHSSAYYYERLNSELVSNVAFSARASIGVLKTTRSGLTVRQDVTVAPVELFQPEVPMLQSGFNSAAYLADDRLLVRDLYMASSTGADFVRQLTSRASLTVGYGFRLSDYPQYGTSSLHEGRGTFRLGLTKALGIRLGYGYGLGSHAISGGRSLVYRHHNIDAGLDFSKQLSLSRKTSFAFSTGFSAVGHQRQPFYRLIGNAQLTYQITRSWAASVSYRRNLEYASYLADVLFGDSVTARLGGPIGRNLSVHVAGGVTAGAVGLGGGRNGALTKYATAGLSRTMSRYIRVAADYTYFTYAFEADAALRAGIPRERARHSVRASLSLSAPLFATRSLNAAR